jgi:hypothetical protein
LPLFLSLVCCCLQFGFSSFIDCRC